MSNVAVITSNEFEQEVESHQGRVLVDFFAEWCAPCKMISPIIEQVSQDSSDLKVVKVDADDAQALMSKYGIRGIPTLLLFDNGAVVGSNVGAASLSQVRQFVSE